MSKILFYALISAIASVGIWTHASWPMNHSRLDFFFQAEAFHRFFLEGQYFPTWWAAGENGWGSPWPLFYHKLFISLAALLTPLTQSTYLSVAILVPVFLCIGALGVDRFGKVLGLTASASRWSSVLFVFAPYTYTDWLRRGAMAEFAAMMILPWVFTFAVESKKDRRQAWVLGLSMVLLFHAHSVIAFFAYLGLFIFAWRRRLLKSWSIPLGICLGVGVLPFAYVIHRLMPEFSFQSMTEGYWAPRNHLRTFWDYFWFPNFSWGKDMGELTPELGRFLWIAVLWRALWNRTRVVPRYLQMLMIGGLITQSRFFVWIYDVIPFAKYIQFPWRMDGFLTLFLCLIFAFQLQARPSRLMVLLAFAQIAWGLQSQFQWQEGWSRAKVDEYLRQVQNPNLTRIAGMIAFNSFEYLPKRIKSDSPPEMRPLIEVTSGSVTLTPNLTADRPILGEYKIKVEAKVESMIVVNQFATKLLALSVDGVESPMSMRLSPGHHELVLSARNIGSLDFVRSIGNDPR